MRQVDTMRREEVDERLIGFPDERLAIEYDCAGHAP
jgi:hypothetical protein